MKKIGLIVGLLILWVNSTFAVDGLSLSVQGNDVVLRWQSQTNAIYIIQYRATLDPNDFWQTLTNSYPGAAGTNWTTFVHTNIVCYPTSGGGGGGGGGSPFAPSSASGQAEQTETDGPPMPPLPWDTNYWNQSSSSQLSSFENETSSASMSSLSPSVNSCNTVTTSSNVCSGFYRVFAPTPITRIDVLGVDQGSVSNQLDILANDIDPDDNPFLLSAVQSAAHGTIEYSDDASIFLYTPTNTFYGLDTFSYGVTNDVGGTNFASVYVFVNQTGNNFPSAPGLEYTLMTNETVISFPILTNATDPDSNSLQFVVFEQPLRGTAETNGSGQVIYTRTSRYIAQDTFYYVLSDGHGGFVKRGVTIIPQDDDGDGIPDDWELEHGLDVTQNDAFDDSDGDGLPNLAEYKLDTCPNGADNPLNLENVATNQVFRDFTSIPVPLKSYIDKQPISLLISTNSADAMLTKRSDGYWYVSWDTGFLTNGSYSIALKFRYNPDAQPPDSNSITGSNKTVVVTNEVIFNQLASSFGEFLVFDVKFPTPTNYWRIELFDDANQYLGYFSGLTTNGTVLGAWDLTDGQGHQLAASHVRTDFYTSASSGSPTGGTTRKAKRWFVKQISGGIGDKFVLAWGWDEYGFSFNNAREDLMKDGVINIIGNPSLSDEYQLLPVQNIPYTSAFRYDDKVDRELLINSLKSTASGNFFWFGHGDTTLIQGNGKKSSISSDDVENELQNKKHRSTPKKARENKHPYRLVILNGCETYSKEWANSFGIDFSANGTTNDIVSYFQYGRPGQAFVGWTKEVRVPRKANPTSYNAMYAEGLAYFFAAWMDGYAIETCLSRYVERMDHYSFGGHDSWKLSGAAGIYRTAP